MPTHVCSHVVKDYRLHRKGQGDTVVQGLTSGLMRNSVPSGSPSWTTSVLPSLVTCWLNLFTISRICNVYTSHPKHTLPQQHSTPLKKMARELPHPFLQGKSKPGDKTPNKLQMVLNRRACCVLLDSPFSEKAEATPALRLSPNY